MFIHIWIFIVLFIIICVVAFLSLVLMTREGVRLDEERERNAELTEENKGLAVENARLKARENIRIANEYSTGLED